MAWALRLRQHDAALDLQVGPQSGDVAQVEAAAAKPEVGRSEGRAFRPDIEGLRAVAVGLVVLNHAGVPYFSGGYVGVDVFFVLSGFLITGLLIKERHGGDGTSLARFYARRVRRILPASTVVLISSVVAGYTLLGASRASRITEDARWSAIFASNARFIQQGTDYFAYQLAPSPLQHFWSLAVEEQFYLVWPVIFVVVALLSSDAAFRRTLGVVLVVIITASFVWSVIETSMDGTAAYFSPFPRAWELAIGALLALVAPVLVGLPRRIGLLASLAGFLGILTAAVWFTKDTPFPGYVVALPVMAAAAVVAGGTIAPGASPERVLRWPALQWTGRRSFSLYLWHWPVLVIVAGVLGRGLSVGESLLACGVALGLAAVTFALVENPIRSSRRLQARPPLYSVALGGALVVACLVIGTGLLTIVPGPSASSAATPQLIFPPK